MESARTFTIRLAGLLAQERAALGEFLVGLAEFDRRRLWLDLGYGSLFDFLHRELGLSKGAAFYRKTAVDLIHRFPEIVEPLRDGRLCLMSVAEVARVLTPGNRNDVLPRFFGLSKREAQTLAATLLPRESPPNREVVTAVPFAGAGRAPSLAQTAPALALAPPFPAAERASVQPVEPPRASVASVCGPAPAESASAPARTVAPAVASQPLTADLSRLHVTVSRRFLEKLEKARAALSHSHPGASADEILEAGLDLLLERHARRRGLVKKPRPVAPPCGAEHVPAQVRREVWERDGGRCQWPLWSGGICGSTHRVELDHRTPRARGGPATPENLRLLCRRHNDLAAREAFGDDWMDRFTRGGAPSREDRFDAVPG